MDNEIKTWLYDMRNAIIEIESFFTHGQKIFTEFERDIKTKRAVERNLEIIGEAVNRILKKDPTFILSNSRKIVDTRNLIIHGYDSVTDEIIWSIIINHLPVLKSEVSAYLN